MFKVVNTPVHQFMPVVLLLFLTTPCFCIGQKSEHSSTNLEFDHVLIFTNDYTLKESLDSLFTPAEKLTTQHNNQGTIGYYYLFHNMYIELLFMTDSATVIKNQANFKSNYLERWNIKSNSFPIGFGMIMEPWDSSNVEFETYRSADAFEDEFYLMSRHNNEVAQPLVYVSMPHRSYDHIESLEDLNKIENEEVRKDLKDYLDHLTGVKKATELVLSAPKNELSGNNYKLIGSSSMIRIEESHRHSLTIFFDNRSEKQKVFHLTKGFDLILHY